MLHLQQKIGASGKAIRTPRHSHTCPNLCCSCNRDSHLAHRSGGKAPRNGEHEQGRLTAYLLGAILSEFVLHLSQKMGAIAARPDHMHPKTEEFLNLLLWSAEMLAKPTFRNLTMGSYEGWVYRNGLRARIRALEKGGTLEANRSSGKGRCYRLTEHGRLHALGGRDPQAQWSRVWDRRWRLVLFDVPVRHGARRESLRRSLREQAFGRLQGSVWVSPDPLNLDEGLVKKGKVAGESLCLMEAQPGPGMRDADIVEEAWDFNRINSHYTRHLGVLEACPDEPLRTAAAARAMQRWSAQERAAWLAAVTIDPLLPKPLLPRRYLGCQAWQRRIDMLRRARRRLLSFQPRCT